MNCMFMMVLTQTLSMKILLSSEFLNQFNTMVRNELLFLGALIKKQIMMFSDGVKPHCIPTRSQENDSFAGRKATIAGFGKLHDADQYSSNNIHMATNREIIPQDECLSLIHI